MGALSIYEEELNRMEDRRIQKTKNAIQAAFASLLTKKSINKMTVVELCELANINKSTFYLHYRDIYDCANYLRDTITAELLELLTPYSYKEIIRNLSKVIEDIIAVFNRNQELYMPFLQAPSLSHDLCIIRDAVIEKILEKIDEEDRQQGVDSFLITFLIGGIINTLGQHDFKEIDQESLEKLASKVQNGFLPPIAKEYL